jgi:hypothetical protein
MQSSTVTLYGLFSTRFLAHCLQVSILYCECSEKYKRCVIVLMFCRTQAILNVVESKLKKKAFLQNYDHIAERINTQHTSSRW